MDCWIEMNSQVPRWQAEKPIWNILARQITACFAEIMSWDGCWFVGINFLGKEKPSVDEVDVILLIGETKMPCPWNPPWFSPDSCSMTMTRGRIYIWIFPKIVGFPPKSSILIGFSILNHPFGGTPIFGNTHIWQWIEFPYLPRVVVWPKKWPQWSLGILRILS